MALSKQEISRRYYLKNKDKINERNKQWRENNLEQSKLLIKNWATNNVDKIQEADKKYRSNNKEKIRVKNSKRDKEKLKEYNKIFHQNNPDYNKIYLKKSRMERIKTDSLYRVKEGIRCLIKVSINNRGYSKNSRTSQILGCTFEFFKSYIEKQFTDGMTWDNHGKWHYDHKIPISSATTEEEIIALNHYTNFQPLWAEENRKKSNKIYSI